VRRALTLAVVTSSVVLLTALPALADTVEDGGTRGSVSGIVLALVFGGIFAGAIVTLAYRDADFGEEPAHQEEAHDIRDGAGGGPEITRETTAPPPSG
jgi:hypothetical protein